MYKKGGEKEQWISDKITKLMDEGKSHDQAVAQALYMSQEMFQEGGAKNINELITQSTDSINSSYKPIKNIQKGVTNAQGKSGVYFYYKLPQEGGFDPKVDREFISNDYFSQQKRDPSLKNEALDAYFRKNPTQIFEEGGELPKYQVGVQQKSYKDPVIGQFYGQDISGGFKGYDTNNPITPKLQFPSTTYNPSYIAPQTNNWLPGNVEGNEVFTSTPNFQEKTSQTNTVAPTTTNSTVVPTTTTEASTPQLQPEVKSIFETVPNLKPSTTNTEEQLQRLGKKQADEAGLTQNKQPNFNSNYQDPYQFFNPYGGVDIASGAQFLGQSIENKDPFGIVMGGLKVATGVGRNVFGGMGRENVRNEAMKNYFDNQYEGITGTPQYLSNGIQNEGLGFQNGGVFQEGGEQMGGEHPAPQEQPQQVNPEEIMNQVAQAIQQGADPQQIVQQLVSMGIPEQEAMQLVQGLIQQMQSQAPAQEQPVMRDGGDYMSVLRGKRIKDYVLNEQTGNYEVTYED